MSMSDRTPNVPWFVYIALDVPVDIQVYRSPTDTWRSCGVDHEDVLVV